MKYNSYKPIGLYISMYELKTIPGKSKTVESIYFNK